MFQGCGQLFTLTPEGRDALMLCWPLLPCSLWLGTSVRWLRTSTRSDKADVLVQLNGRHGNLTPNVVSCLDKRHCSHLVLECSGNWWGRKQSKSGRRLLVQNTCTMPGSSLNLREIEIVPRQRSRQPSELTPEALQLQINNDFLDYAKIDMASC